MAVDYYPHIVVTGPRKAIGDFVDRIALNVSRRVAGVTRKTIVPFSFESLYAMTKMKDEVPHDAYDMTRWPIVQRGRAAEVRYRFHTRNLEVNSSASGYANTRSSGISRDTARAGGRL